MTSRAAPRLIRVLEAEADRVRQTPYGTVGEVHSDSRIEAVWVRKEHEEIEPGWFSQPEVDLLIVLQGELRVEFERPGLSARVMKPGDLLVLPGGERCRVYRWPRDRREATVFLAVYPNPGGPELR